MATTPKAPKATAPVATNVFAALAASAVAAPTVAPAPAPKVHNINVQGAPVSCANHCAVLKGAKPLSAVLAASTYTLGAKVYAPKAGTLNAHQWLCVNMALESGPATGAQIAASFVAGGLRAGHAAQFVPYAANAGWLMLA